MSESPGGPEAKWREFCAQLGAQAKFGGEFGLGTIRHALDAEDHPEETAPALTVAGTNGKGGTAAFLAGILQAHGLPVGLYTSPHLIDPAERFRIDGRPAARGELLEIARPLFDRYRIREEGDAGLTYFELTTLIATEVFRQRDVDAAVYEVGLGGRFDAVNAIEPALGVITDIDNDHTEYLGETIEEIAREKGGIARPDRPLIIGRQSHANATATLIESTPAEPLTVYGEDFDASDVESAFDQGLSRGPEDIETLPWTKHVNAATAYRAAQVFLEAEFDHQTAQEGIRRTRWPGRFDWRRLPASRFETEQPVEILFDAAHNPGAVGALFDQLTGWPERFAGVVCGGMADKELDAMFAHLDGGPPVWGVTLPSQRAAGPDRLAEAIPAGTLQAVGTPDEALGEAARDADRQGGHLLVFGSVYLVGACFEAVGLTADDLLTFR